MLEVLLTFSKNLTRLKFVAYKLLLIKKKECMLLVHTYILLPHAVTKYGAHADITRRKMRGYDAFALQKQTHPTPTGSPPPPKCAARVGNIYARLTFDMLIRALIGPLIDRVTRYCKF